MVICFESPEQLLQFMQDFDYKKFDTLMSTQDVGYYGEGSCHDQVFYELEALEALGLAPQAKFIMAVDKDGIGGETHSFVYWVDIDKAYWFENAWEDYRGIHEFASESELIDAVVGAFKARNPRNYVYIATLDPEDHVVGEDLDTFVDICMTDAALV